MILAYIIVSLVLLVFSLISTSPPRSLVLIALAALLWPLTLAAIAMHACAAQIGSRPTHGHSVPQRPIGRPASFEA